MAWDIGLVLFEHFYVHVKVHKDAKKKNETNIQPPCSNKLGQLLEAKLNMWYFAQTKPAIFPAWV